ncbi:sulfatase-like hydrolase/transferase [Candidatus Laterigemmans baculatus]|uniref:sulfatase-like hydrolase/transferase n=1 Tax=Candidatus Laterigemmans baculatus TaxID=2770505 RepID=UPI0013DAFCCB|nr:sulfatase-like hydrolase/transferase [Candidatus Laterigemmans baculatus]
MRKLQGLGRILLCLGCWAVAGVAPHRSSGSEADAPKSESGSERPPNILFLLTDDQRPDTVAALGNTVIKTPHLDSLARRGTAFTRATCAHPLCVPSRPEILTGCTGFRNGVHPPHNKPDPSLTTWPAAMQEAGYHSWWVGKWHLAGRPTTRGYSESLGLFSSGGSRFPLAYPQDYRGEEVTGYRGWIFQSDDRQLQPEHGVGLTPTINARFADAAIKFLARRSPQPFFLHVNFTAPHDPLLVPPGDESKYDPAQIPLPNNFQPQHPFDHGNFDGRDEQLLPWPRTEEIVRRDLAAYYAVISDLDAQIGRILKALEQNGHADNTIVIFSSDHGLAMGSHGLRGKQNMYEHTINVPLIFAGPGIPAGETRAAQCYLRDLFPTTCELAGVPVPKSVQGKSLVPVLHGQTDEIYPFIVGYFGDSQRMIRTDRWKYIWYPQINHEQLFDLQNDRDELHNLAAAPSHTRRRSELRQQLLDWLGEHDDPLATTKNP